MKQNIIQSTLCFLILVGISSCSLWKKDLSFEYLKSKYTDSTSRFITIKNCNIHYQIYGKGKPIMFLHGTGSSLHTWSKLTNYLKSNYQIIAIDIPGFGLSGTLEKDNYTIHTYVEIINEFISQLQIPQPTIVGNSLGGEIAWNFAATYPSHISKLILISPDGFHLSKKKKIISNSAIAEEEDLVKIMNKIDPKIFIEQNLKKAYYDDSLVTDSLITIYYELSLKEGNRKAVFDRIRWKGKEIENDISKITAETLLIWGENDLIIPVSLSEKYRSIKTVEVVIVPNIGHTPQEENPERIINQIDEFLK